MKHALLVALIITLPLSLLAEEQLPWYVHYEMGLDLISDGKGKEAREELEKARKQLSEPGLQIPTRLSRYIDYMPNLYLAIASHMSGDKEATTKYLTAAEKAGVAASSDAGSALLVAYQMLIRESPTAIPRYEMYDPDEAILSQEEYLAIKRKVLMGADYGPELSMEDAPWYVHYELGLELEEKKDHSRAIQAFVQALHRRPNPDRHVRTYGMWVIDYYPFFHIAKNQAMLKNWNAAADAITISERLREVPYDAASYNELEDLRRRVTYQLR